MSGNSPDDILAAALGPLDAPARARLAAQVGHGVVVQTTHADGTPGDPGDVATLNDAGSGYVAEAPSGGGTDSGIQVADVQLTDAQIKALPTGDATLLPAPGAGLAYVFHGAHLLCDTTSGVYTGLGTDSTLQVVIGGFGASARVDELYNTSVTGLFAPGPAGLVTVQLPSYATSNANGFYIRSDAPAPVASVENQPMTLEYANNEATALTGGNAANTLSLRVWFSVVPTTPFGA